MARKNVTTYRVHDGLSIRLRGLADLLRRSANETVELLLEDALDRLDEPPGRRTPLRIEIEVDTKRMDEKERTKLAENLALNETHRVQHRRLLHRHK